AEGGTSRCNMVSVIPLQQKLDAWMTAHDCTGPGKAYRKHPHGTCTSWSCEKAPFVLCEVDAGREWIGEPPEFSLTCKGVVTSYPHAEEMWRFLETEGRPLD